MQIRKKSFVWHKLNGLFRYGLVHSSTRIFPLYIVNEYPKSGGSWVGQMLSEAIDVPFPRNRFPQLSPCIMHGHFMHKWNMHNVLNVWRDGRDVLISQYYHSLIRNDESNSRLVALCRADLKFDDYQDIEANLVPFMEYVFEAKKHPKMSWSDFVERWADCPECVHVHYEDLRQQPERELCRVVNELADLQLSPSCASDIVQNYSFEKLSGRQTGVENTRSFLRKGLVGDWKNYFSLEARERFHQYAGHALIKLGYEADDTWITKTGSQ